MALVVGYDRRPASRAAVLLAGEIAGALTVPVHVVHVVNMSDSPVLATAKRSADADRWLDSDRRHVGDALDAAHVQWSYHLLKGDPVTAILKAADELAARVVVSVWPQHGIGPALGRFVTGKVARNLLRHSTRPVVVVPEFADSL